MSAIDDPSFTATLSTPELVAFAALFLTVAGVVVFAAFRLPLQLVLGVSFVAGLLQFYGPLGFMSGALFLTALTLPAMVVRTFPLVRTAWPLVLVALAIWQALSTLWSATIGSAAFGVLGTLALLAVFLNSMGVLAEGRGSVRGLLRVVAPFLWVHIVLTVAFRVFPAFELSYLTSPLATLFTEPGVETIASGGQANVLDPAKSGGLILNGNVASLMLGMAAVIFCIAGIIFSSRWFIATAAAACVAAVLTGSKSVLVIITLGIIAVALVGVAVRHLRRAVVVGVASLAVIILSSIVLPVVAPGMVSQAVRTLGERGVLWSLVFESFPERWFFGFGFGNWRNFMIERMQSSSVTDATTRILPPHNLFLQAWVDAGLVSLMLTMFAAVVPIVIAIKVVGSRRHEPFFSKRSMVASLLLLGVIWPIAHGMTDTTVFFGDNHTIAMYGFLVACVFEISRRQAKLTDSSFLARPGAGSSETK